MIVRNGNKAGQIKKKMEAQTETDMRSGRFEHGWSRHCLTDRGFCHKLTLLSKGAVDGEWDVGRNMLKWQKWRAFEGSKIGCKENGAMIMWKRNKKRNDEGGWENPIILQKNWIRTSRLRFRVYTQMASMGKESLNRPRWNTITRRIQSLCQF